LNGGQVDAAQVSVLLITRAPDVVVDLASPSPAKSAMKEIQKAFGEHGKETDQSNAKAVNGDYERATRTPPSKTNL